MQRTQSAAEYRDAMRNQMVTIVPIRSLPAGAAAAIGESLVGRGWLEPVGKHCLGPQQEPWTDRPRSDVADPLTDPSSIPDLADRAGAIRAGS